MSLETNYKVGDKIRLDGSVYKVVRIVDGILELDEILQEVQFT